MLPDVTEFLARNRRDIWSFVSAYLCEDMAPVSSEEYFDIQRTIECRFTLKRVRDLIIAYSQCTVYISNHNTAQSFGQFG